MAERASSTSSTAAPIRRRALLVEAWDGAAARAASAAGGGCDDGRPNLDGDDRAALARVRLGPRHLRRRRRRRPRPIRHRRPTRRRSTRRPVADAASEVAAGDRRSRRWWRRVSEAALTVRQRRAMARGEPRRPRAYALAEGVAHLRMRRRTFVPPRAKQPVSRLESSKIQLESLGSSSRSKGEGAARRSKIAVGAAATLIRGLPRRVK